MPSRINPHFLKLTPLGYRYGGDTEDKTFVGTGFFYRTQYTEPLFTDTEDLPPFGPYLVTNRHVVDPAEDVKPDQLTFYIRSRDNIHQPTRYQIPLYDSDQEPIWIEHPRKDTDVVLILLDYELASPFTFTRESIPRRGDIISGGDLGSVIGYPDALPEFQRYPIIRGALISSPYKVAFEEEDFFYFDARLHAGMSGSPIMNIPAEYLPIDKATIYQNQEPDEPPEPREDLEIQVDSRHLDTTSQYLLGIHSDERIRVGRDSSLREISDRLSEIDSNEDNSSAGRLESILEMIEGQTGLNVAWHSKLIEEIRKESDVTESYAVQPI